jgi:hypothetical protein
MKISELIKRLEEIKAKEGDLAVHYDFDGQDQPVENVGTEKTDGHLEAFIN